MYKGQGHNKLQLRNVVEFLFESQYHVDFTFALRVLALTVSSLPGVSSV